MRINKSIYLFNYTECNGISPLLWIWSNINSSCNRPNCFLRLFNLNLLLVCFLGATAFSSEQKSSHNQLQSVDVSESLKDVLENLKCAQATGADANAKASVFERDSRESAARLGNLVSSSQAHHREFVNLLNFQIQALRTRLEAARRNAPLIEAASKSLEEIRTSTRTDVAEEAHELGTARAEVSDSHDILDFEIQEQDVLAAACEFYRLASRMSVDPAAVQIVTSCVAKWASKNRSAITLGETRLRKLQAALQEEIAANAPTINDHTNSRLVWSDQPRVRAPNVQMTAPTLSTVIVYRQPYWTAPIVTFYSASQGVYCYCSPSQYSYWAFSRPSFFGGYRYGYWQQRAQNQVTFSGSPAGHAPRQHRR